MPKRQILSSEPVQAALSDAFAAVTEEAIPARMAQLARQLQDAVDAPGAAKAAPQKSIPATDDQAELHP